MWRVPLLWSWSIGPIVSLELPQTLQRVVSEPWFGLAEEQEGIL
ncbi:hypothetical protein A2U01_0083735, partial [Trifolium medium]|nr:hypothetical protein [Trifolium medium]